MNGDSPTLDPAAAALLQALGRWRDQGWLRRLDHAFARFVVDLDPRSPPPLLMAAAMLAHVEGRGHACLPIDQLVGDADRLLGWPAAAAAELRQQMAALPARPEDWLAALRASPLVDVEGAAPRDRADAAAAGVAASPLVLGSGQRLYLRRYRGYELRVAAQVLQRVRTIDSVAPHDARRWLDRLFPPALPTLPAAADGAGVAADATADGSVDWQKVACAMALRGRLSLVTGGPGTGKTYTAARLLALLFAVDAEPQRLRVALAAPTGKAAARLKQSIDSALTALVALRPSLVDDLPLRDLAARIGPARTLHALLGVQTGSRRFRADAAHPLAVDLLIVDEASMVHLEMMAALLDALPPQARLVLLGDKDQLASVEAGSVLGDLCHRAEDGHWQPATAAAVAELAGQQLPPRWVSGGPALAQHTVMLRSSHRFGGPIGALARAVNAGDAEAASALLPAAPGQPLQWLAPPSPAALVALAVQGRPGAEGGYGGHGSYLEVLARRPAASDEAAHPAWQRAVLAAFDGFRLLCAVRDGEWGVAALNRAVEQALVGRGLLVKRGEWYEGRPVIVTRNDPAIGVFNGDVGIVLRPAAPGAPLRACFADGDAVRSVGVSRLADVATAFALTVHQAQGSEFAHTVLVLPQQPSRVLTRELVYTGVSRARGAFTLVTGRRQAFAEALAQRTLRASGLLELLGDDGHAEEPAPDQP